MPEMTRKKFGQRMAVRWCYHQYEITLCIEFALSQRFVEGFFSICRSSIFDILLNELFVEEKKFCALFVRSLRSLPLVLSLLISLFSNFGWLVVWPLPFVIIVVVLDDDVHFNSTVQNQVERGKLLRERPFFPISLCSGAVSFVSVVNLFVGFNFDQILFGRANKQ